VTNGIISAMGRSDVGISDLSFFIQTDAPINPGNSGGPLVDMAGNIIGINTAIYSRSGSSAGIGFAIPAAMVRRVVESALGGGRSVQRAWLGARTQSVTQDMARSLGLDRPTGVVVASVYPGSAAANAGLREGDVILSVDGTPVNDQAALNYLVATRRPGTTMRLSVRSGAQTRNVTVRAETAPDRPARDQRTLSGDQPLSGATVVNLSPAAAEELGFDPFLSGVVIARSGGIAAQAGFRAGDIVREVNGRRVASVADLAAAVRTSGRWRIVIERNGETVVAQF
jgi:S1-C subfamily serine protease